MRVIVLVLFEIDIEAESIDGIGLPVGSFGKGIVGRTQLIVGFNPVGSGVIVILCTNGMAPTEEPTAGVFTIVVVEGVKLVVLET